MLAARPKELIAQARAGDERNILDLSEDELLDIVSENLMALEFYQAHVIPMGGVLWTNAMNNIAAARRALNCKAYK